MIESIAILTGVLVFSGLPIIAYTSTHGNYELVTKGPDWEKPNVLGPMSYSFCNDVKKVVLKNTKIPGLTAECKKVVK